MTNSLNHESITDAPADAATVILLRDSDVGLQTLLLCRGNSKTVMNNAWVFPGGKIDTADFRDHSFASALPQPAAVMLNEPELGELLACALFNTACRETLEETGVSLRCTDIVPWSRWITPNEPSVMKKRFDARFFVAALPDGQHAFHDGSEATDSAWHTPRSALTAYCNHEITLAPPQILTLCALHGHHNIAACLAHAHITQTYCIEPVVSKTAEGTRSLFYPGDPQHHDPIKLMPGPTRIFWHNGHFEPEGGFEQWLN